MKKFTLFFVFAILGAFSFSSYAQTLNQAASWPNGSWTLSGTYTGAGLLADPTVAGTTFTFDDDAAGNGSLDDVQATSPVIDLTAANGAGETDITISGDYTYRALGGDTAAIEIYDADALTWSAVETFSGNVTNNDYQTCANSDAYTTAIIDISGYTATQLSGFQYRFSYDDNDGWQYGVCFTSPTIVSASPATCFDVSGLTLDSSTATSATISWTASVAGETNWEIAVQADGTGTPGTGDGSGTDTATNPHTASSLTAQTAYEVYVRAECTAGTDFGGWVGPLDFTTPCAAVVPDYTADMSTNAPDSGACWEEAGAGEVAAGPSSIGFSDWQNDTDYAVGGSNEINLFGSSDREWLLSPAFDLSADGYELVVNVAVTEWNDGFTADTMGSDDEVQLLMSTDGGTTWSNLTTWNVGNQPPVGGTEYIEDLTGTTGTDVRFAIWASDGTVDDAEDYDFHIGQFVVRTPPACPDVSSLTASNIDGTSADIGWTNGGSETDWEVAVQAQGTGTPGGAGASTSTNPYNATGLTSSTAYEAYVRSDCGGGDLGGWIGPINFTTAAACGDTVYDTGGAGANYGNSESYTITYLPDAPGNVVTLDFTSVALENCCDTLSVYDGLTTADPAFNADLEAPDTFTATSASGAITIEFDSDTSVTGAGWEANYTCAAPPTCLDVSAISVSGISTTTADVAWTNGDPGDTDWEVAVQAQGTGMPGAADGSGTDTSSNPYSATGLTAQTDYEVYVRTDCGAGDLSNWVGPVNFSTLCPTLSLPLVEGFESGVPPDCWTSFRGTNGEGTGFDWTTTAVSNTGASAAFVRYENVATAAEDWLVTPALDMSTSTNPELSFFASQDFAGAFGSVYTVRVSTTDTDHASFTTVETYTEADFSVDSYDQYIVDLSAYASEATVYVAFVMDNDDGDNWYLDDVVIYDNVPTTFTYTSGTWAPFNPLGLASSDDDVIIAAGNSTMSSDLSCNTMTVNPGAGLTVESGVTLTTAGGTTLESSSTSYSSLILDGTVAGGMTYERHVNMNGSGTTGSNDLVSPPLTGQAFNVFAAANTNILNNGTLYLFGPFEKVTGQYVNWEAIETSTLDPGVGYRTGTTDNGTVTFTGTANNGTVTNDIINGGTNNEEWNLVGNPYPSYLNVQDFLNHDVGGVTNIQLFDAPTAAIYGYDGSALNGWTIYNLATTSASTLIAPGQGFMISADATNTGPYDLEFTPAMRRTGSSDDFIVGRNDQLTYMTISLSSNNNVYSTDFYFNAKATEGFDVGYDAAVYGDSTPDFAIYSSLVQGDAGEAFALQALKDTDLTNVTIPLGVNANQGEQITFSIHESTLPANVKVYLDDTVKNTTTLLNDVDYTLTPKADLSGTGRFFLRYEENASIENGLAQLDIFSLNASDELVVSGQLENNAMLNLFDIQGRQVLTTSLDNSLLQNRINVSNITAGIYLVTVQSDSQEITKKVIIE